jgi:hypothetical protein
VGVLLSSVNADLRRVVVKNGLDDGIRSTSSGALTLTGVTVANNGDNTGDDGVAVVGVGSTTISSSTFTDSFSSQVSADGGTGVTSFTLQDSTLSSAPGTTTVGGVGVVQRTGSTMTVVMTGDTVTGAVGNAVALVPDNSLVATPTLRATIDHLVVGQAGAPQSGSTTANGVLVQAAVPSTVLLRLTNSSIHGYAGSGIRVAASGTAHVDVTLLANTVADPGTSAIAGLSASSAPTGDLTGRLCLDPRSNVLSAGALSPPYSLNAGSGYLVALAGYAGAAHDATAVQAYLAANNTTPAGSVTFSGPAPGFTGGGACLQP